MYVPKNHEVTMRCPVCFEREIDVLMKYEEETKTHKCLKCSFTGDEKAVRERYAHIRGKFLWNCNRITIEDYDKL